MSKTTGKRTKRSSSSEAISNISDFVYNSDIGGNKVSEGVMGVLQPKGEAPTTSPGMGFDSGTYVALYNNNSSAVAARFTALPTDPAPTSLANGSALRPNNYTILVVPFGLNYLKVSTTGVFVYEMSDDTLLSKREEFNE